MPPQPSLCPSSPQVVGTFGVHWQVPAVLALEPTQVLFASPPPVLQGQVRFMPLGPSGKAPLATVEHFAPMPPPAP